MLSLVGIISPLHYNIPVSIHTLSSPHILIALTTCWPLSLSLYLSPLLSNTRCQYVELLSVLGHIFVLLADGPASFFLLSKFTFSFFTFTFTTFQRKEKKQRYTCTLTSFVMNDGTVSSLSFHPLFFKFRFIIFHLDNIFF